MPVRRLAKMIMFVRRLRKGRIPTENVAALSGGGSARRVTLSKDGLIELIPARMPKVSRRRVFRKKRIPAIRRAILATKNLL